MNVNPTSENLKNRKKIAINNNDIKIKNNTKKNKQIKKDTEK